MMDRPHLSVVIPIQTGGRDYGERMKSTLAPVALKYVGERVRRGEIEPITARCIRNHLLDFAWSFGNRPLNQLGHRAVERWLEEMQEKGLAPSTRAVRMSSLRTFARWCVISGVVDKDWTLLAPKVRRPRVVPRDMTNEHVALVLARAATDRELLMGWLMFGCGLRCVEVHRLDVEDLDRISMQLHVTGKARHEREVSMPLPVLHIWDRYLSSVGHHGGALIRYEDGTKRLGPERISGIIGRLCRESGVKVRAYDGRSAHGLRAAAASDLYDACHDAMVVQEFLGHANLASGRPYLRRVGEGRVREAQNLRPWAAVGDGIRDAS